MIGFFKNFCENAKLRKERNRFENKYNAILEKYTKEMERKLDITSELQHYKNLCINQKKKIKELKIKLFEQNKA